MERKMWSCSSFSLVYTSFQKSIKDCGLVTYEGCTHYAYLERLNQTINVLNSFIGVDK